MVIEVLAAADALHDSRRLVQTVGGNDEVDRLADRLVGGVSEQTLRGPVPAGHGSVQRLADDRVADRTDHRRIKLILVEMTA